ncbi:hypothetical protein L2Y96_19110 [Luteibacter aegosomaticola]|uniref:hypothetical protein n=1 Tax=Luteibacter aegosomaticola TaxID=2911538 RepID=UPI001FFABE15|nr:hypothetical protein [Luteibacter aegosomaticola]UPG89482.1 hypothetical protein L2Y96_19110 [Luteibacter aegosomaticola]
MEREYTACTFRLDGHDRHFLWYADEPDGVVVGASGEMVTFASEAELLAFGATEGISWPLDFTVSYDLDAVAAWTAQRDAEAIDCIMMLNAWNLFVDIAATFSCKLLEPRGANAVYDKIFWGNNLPTMTPPGEHYVPAWSQEEADVLVGVCKAGLSLLRRAIESPVAR